MKKILKFLFKKSINKYLEWSDIGFNIYYISQVNNWTLGYTRAIERLIEYINQK